MPEANKKTARSGALTGKLEQVRIEDIAPNQHNPRETFDQNLIEQLAASIEEIGLQVPITVYESPQRSSKPYTLLDGERRFRAAKLVNYSPLPALVVPRPSRSENAVRMFNIHMLREDWEEIETAHALQHIIEETEVTKDRDLQRLTGLSIDRIRNMRRVLSFPKHIQEMVSQKEIPYQYLVELDKALLAKRRDEIHEDKQVMDMGVADLRDTFLKRYIGKVDKDVVELRKVGTLYDTAKGEGKIAERAKRALQTLVRSPTITIGEAYESGAASSVELSRVVRDIAALPGRISDLLSGKLEPEQRKQVQDAIKKLQGRLIDLHKKAGG